MLRKSILLGLCFFIRTVLIAAEDETKPQEESRNQLSNYSALERSKKDAEIEIGSRIYSLFGSQLAVSYYQGSDFKYSLTFTFFDRSLLLTNYTLYRGYKRIYISSKYVGLKTSYFLGDTLYVAGEYQYGFGEALIKRTSDIYTGQAEYMVPHRASFLAVSLGNSWSWKNLTLDWSWFSIEKYLYHRVGDHSLVETEFKYIPKTMLLSKIGVGYSF